MRAVRLAICLAVLSTAAPGPPAAAQGRAWTHSEPSGCLVWNPEPAPDQPVAWSGACVDGRADGGGTLTWARGGERQAFFVGTMQGGRFHGRGLLERADGVRREGLYYRGAFVAEGRLDQPILMRAAQASAPPDAPEACAVEVLASSILPATVDVLAGLIEIRRNGALLGYLKFNLDRLGADEIRVARFGYRGCGKQAGPEDRYTFRLWEIALCSIGGRPRGLCERLIAFTGDERDLEQPGR